MKSSTTSTIKNRTIKNHSFKTSTLCLMALLSTASAASLKVYPYTGAKFLAGQQFDIRIEAADLQDFKSATVTLDGKELAGLSQTSSGAGKYEWSLRNQTLNRGGAHTLTVRLDTAAGVVEKTQSWTVESFTKSSRSAKNVIIVVGDGMGWNTLQAAQIIGKGYNSENGMLNGMLETMTDPGGMATVVNSSLDSFITDSANSAAGIMSGQKQEVNALNVYPDNTADTLDNPKFETLGELVKRARGMSLGIVTTTFGTDATPASIATHTRRRGDYSSIADQFFTGPAQPDVLLFGGSRDFIPQTAPGSRRKDNKNWIDDSQKMGFTFVSTREELLKANGNKLFGLFNIDNFSSYLDRAQFKKPEMLGSFTDMPYLWDMSSKAIETLEKNPNGFTLLIEGGMIDKYEHPLDWHRGLWDALELDKTVGMLKEYVKQHPDTLLVVTADHAHSISTYGGYDYSKGLGNREAVGMYEKAGWPEYYKKLDQNGIPLLKDIK